MKYTHLLGNKFTLPDAYLFVMLLWARNFKFNLAEWGNLDRFFPRAKPTRIY